MGPNRGFSLLELLIVVAIILIIASMAVPALLKARQSANESSAVGNMRTISNAEATYQVSQMGNFASIPELVTSGMLDSRFSGMINGYNFTITASGADYTANASPAGTNAGRYGYYMGPDSVVRYATAPSSTCSPCYPTNLSGQPVGKD